MTETARTCTAETPAPPTERRLGWGGSVATWNFGWKHPDAISWEINSDHGDIRYRCPHCNMTYVAEGPDA
jgi:hypothetical protein